MLGKVRAATVRDAGGDRIAVSRSEEDGFAMTIKTREEKIIETDMRRLLDEVDGELKTLGRAIKAAAPVDQAKLAHEYFSVILAMGKQNRISNHKILAFAQARTSKSRDVDVLARRALELIVVQRQQLEELKERLHRLNAALTK